jgi:replication initiation protein RepC
MDTRRSRPRSFWLRNQTTRRITQGPDDLSVQCDPSALQILDTVAEQGLFDASWQKLEGEGRALARALRNLENLDEMTLGVVSLERRQMEARERLETLLAAAAPLATGSVNKDPMGPENRPHQYNYKANPDPIQEQVMAYEESKSRAAAPGLNQETAVQLQQKGQGEGAQRNERTAAPCCGSIPTS